ncbi:MAG: cupin domain-containing protein [Phycisphaerales bacterium]|jgi:quercetin dioxygenase-like cupin family protein|nr:cupin domain-containing protein [Phycisphaerales bacterium]
MSEFTDRLREHPENRFAAPLHQIDINKVANQLSAEPLQGKRLHRQETLYKHASATIALFLFEKDAYLPEHLAEGVVSVQVLQGKLRMNVDGQANELSAGQILVLAPGVKHDVRALEPSRMLLTVCLQAK